MKKLIVLGMLVVAVCSLTGCGENNEVEEAVEQRIEFKQDAEETVEEHNERVIDLEENAKEIEEELE